MCMKGLHFISFDNGLMVDLQCSFQVLKGVDYIVHRILSGEFKGYLFGDNKGTFLYIILPYQHHTPLLIQFLSSAISVS
jgi:hypothetical protein